jgi:Asp-tRNA(Asn)/Glu-tRNA(Gln) amidotransferase A subunit family amidase
MPLGYLGLNGRPFGMAMIAEAHAEGKLLRIMSAWEVMFPRRKASTLLSGKRPDSQL